MPRLILLALSMQLTAPVLEHTAQAAPDMTGPSIGWYVGLRGGASFLPTNDVDGLKLNTQFLLPAPNNRVSYRTGWAGMLSAGYGFRSGFRTEIEIGERENNIRTAFGNPTTIPGLGSCVITDPNCSYVGPTGGATKATTFMLNGLYDIPTDLPVTPYIGIGIGAAHLGEDHVGQPRGIFLNGGRFAFAYQGIAGLSATLAPRFTADIDYRFLGATKRGYDPTFYGNPVPKADYASHAVTLGLRFAIEAR